VALLMKSLNPLTTTAESFSDWLEILTTDSLI
jgi:hypothetical protein